MVHRIVAFCCCALIALSAACGAQAVVSVDMLFRNWNTRDGLPHNRIRSVIRSRDGFLWLATDSGAVRFDGVNFKTFGLGEGLLAPVVLALFETDDGTLWIGTLGGGLCAYRNGRIERVFNTADGLPSNWVSKIVVDDKGDLIVDTLRGMARMKDGRFTIIPQPSGPAAPVVSVRRDVSGTLFGLEAGRYLRRWEDGKWRRDPMIGPHRVNAMTMAPDGRLWAIVDNRLWCHGRSGWQSYQIPGQMQRPNASLAVDSDGTVWLALYRAGLFGFKNGGFITPSPTGDFVPDMVESVAATGDGHVWLTSSEGLYQMKHRNIRAVAIEDPAAPRVANNLGGLVESAPGEFLVATQGGGFYRWKGGLTTRINDDPLLGAGVYGNCLMRASDGGTWLGSTKGLFEMPQDGSFRQHPFPNADDVPIWALAETREGLWIGSGRGQLYSLKNGLLESVSYGGGDEREPIRTITVDRNGDLWGGTRGNGLFWRTNGQWRRLGCENGLLSEVIRTLYFDPDGRLWVGTDGGGLSLRSQQGFISVTMSNGLPSDSVSQIIMDDDGRLWLGTHRGLAVLDGQAVAQMACGNPGDLHPLLINQADGLPAEEFTIVPPLKTSDGSYAFATVRGFVRMHPADFQPDKTRPQVYIERIIANGNPISTSRHKVTLPPGTERLEFEFTGLFFSDPGRLKFRNRLKGVESEWAAVGSRRSAEYRNLQPGTYHFEVEASTGNGLWSDRPGTFEVTIVPYFWQTRWFLFSIIAASFILVALIVRRIERNRSRRRIEILERRQAVDNERARIARDLHDDVGAGLTQMALQSQLAERSITRQPEVASKSMRDIFKTARIMTRALDEIIWTVNPAHDTLDKFISFLGSFTQDFTASAGLSCRFDFPEVPPRLILPATIRHHLYLASKEALHNVVKHAEATEVSLEIRLERGICRIVISDNGRGGEDSPVSIGADGLDNLQSRLHQLGGTCRRSSVHGQGTTVELSVPMDWQNG